ncbi:MAG TPA: hypothetical protein DDY86_07085 [Syntrophaceae bacterium]|nr:hypothetical protein [Syntrophaceae bacterium]
MTTIGEDFPREQRRVRELLAVYQSIGPNGAFGAAMIEQTLSRAEAAAISGDMVAIVRSYKGELYTLLPRFRCFSYSILSISLANKNNLK